MDKVISKIQSAQSIVLSTHRECDGDGLGSQIALYHALKKINKDVRVLNVDEVPVKYSFLKHDDFIQIYEKPHSALQKTDLGLVFDTNDERQLGSLYPELRRQCKDIYFIDHHPLLAEGPRPTSTSYIDTTAASTGEIVHSIIKKLGIELDEKIALALYTSIAFDTQVFRYVRNSPQSHIIASELLKYNIKTDDIHRKLFSTHTIEKISFLSQALGKIEYHASGRIALLKIHESDLTRHGLSTEETRDVIDMIMNIESIDTAVLFREDDTNLFKVSLRSKGNIEVLSTAELLGGGGHRWAAGAVYRGYFDHLKSLTLNHLQEKLSLKNGSSKK